MPKIKRFEELISWQKARKVADFIYQFSREGSFAKDYSLRDQILRACGSIMHNISEGFDSGSDPEMIRFLKIARRSASEVQSELYLALDRKHISPAQMHEAYEQANDIKRLINGLIAYLHKNNGSSTNRIVRELTTEYFPGVAVTDGALTNDDPTNDDRQGDIPHANFLTRPGFNWRFGLLERGSRDRSRRCL